MNGAKLSRFSIEKVKTPMNGTKLSRFSTISTMVNFASNKG